MLTSVIRSVAKLRLLAVELAVVPAAIGLVRVQSMGGIHPTRAPRSIPLRATSSGGFRGRAGLRRSRRLWGGCGVPSGSPARWHAADTTDFRAQGGLGP
jgi:hypothetical protein